MLDLNEQNKYTTRYTIHFLKINSKSFQNSAEIRNLLRPVDNQNIIPVNPSRIGEELFCSIDFCMAIRSRIK